MQAERCKIFVNPLIQICQRLVYTKLRAMLDSKRCKYIGSLRKKIFLNDKSSKRFFTIFGEMYQPTWYKVPKLDKSVKNKLFGKKMPFTVCFSNPKTK